MYHLDRAHLGEITVYVGEKDYHDRQKLRDMLVAEGIKNVSTHSSMDSLQPLMQEVPPDLLFLSDTLDPNVFELAEEVRFNKLGQNPFIISLLVSPNRPENITKAIEAGADDIIIRPLQPNKIYDRLRMITYYRQPFVATSEYIGPERKDQSFNHPGARRVNVLNTIFEKVSGRTFNEWELKEAIKGSLSEVVEAQLASQSMKMGLICDNILDAYNSGLVTSDVADMLESLAAILKEAESMAASVKDESLQDLCGSLAKNVNLMHSHYESATPEELGLIDKLAQAFRMAIDSAAQRKEDEEAEIAARYEGRVAGRPVEV